MPGSGSTIGLRPWKPGQSGNLHGRAVARANGVAAVATRIAAATDDGRELVEVVLTILRDPSAGRAIRLEAATWLADRWLGKPIQATEMLVLRGRVDDQQEQYERQRSGLDLSRLSDEQIAQLASLCEAALPSPVLTIETSDVSREVLSNKEEI